MGAQAKVGGGEEEERGRHPPAPCPPRPPLPSCQKPPALSPLPRNVPRRPLTLGNPPLPPSPTTHCTPARPPACARATHSAHVTYSVHEHANGPSVNKLPWSCGFFAHTRNGNSERVKRSQRSPANTSPWHWPMYAANSSLCSGCPPLEVFAGPGAAEVRRRRVRSLAGREPQHQPPAAG